jgi:hypothetical protein
LDNDSNSNNELQWILFVQVAKTANKGNIARPGYKYGEKAENKESIGIEV